MASRILDGVKIVLIICALSPVAFADTKLSYGWHGFTGPSVKSTVYTDYPSVRSSLAGQSHELELLFERIETWQFWQRASFAVGLTGLAIATVGENQNKIPARTFGNGLWGVGTVCWLGIGAAIKGWITDANQKFQKNESRVKRDEGYRFVFNTLGDGTRLVGVSISLPSN